MRFLFDFPESGQGAEQNMARGSFRMRWPMQEAIVRITVLWTRRKTILQAGLRQDIRRQMWGLRRADHRKHNNRFGR